MVAGTVKWYNASTHYGFVEASDGSHVAFVHRYAIENAGLSELIEGQKVNYDLVPGMDGKASAENLEIIE